MSARPCDPDDPWWVGMPSDWMPGHRVAHPGSCPHCGCDPLKLRPPNAWVRVPAENAPIMRLLGVGEDKTIWAKCGSLWVPAEYKYVVNISAGKIREVMKEPGGVLAYLASLRLLKEEP